MAAVATPPTIRDLVGIQRRIVELQDYDVLGQIDLVHTTRGTMDFGKAGPTIAQHRKSGALLLLTEWNGLPDLRKLLPDPCPSCLTKCDECEKGRRVCTYPGCGGQGHLNAKTEPCPDCLEKTGKFSPDCETCKGRGQVFVPEKCPNCKGKGTAACALCKGTGKMATGHRNGSTKRDAPACAACDGQGQKVQKTPQDPERFVHGQLEGFVALGPIKSLLWHTLGVGGRFQVCEVLPDAGQNLMVLLLESLKPGSRAYLLGGIPQIRAQ